MRIAFSWAGGRCVWSCEIDAHCRKQYEVNFGERPKRDIIRYGGEGIDIDAIKRKIPDHDVLVAGFPCQAFSISGVTIRNANDRQHGFESTDGKLIFSVIRIAAAKMPRVILLENVLNLIHHDGGETFKIITVAFQQLGYVVSFSAINAESEVPQARRRVYIVCRLGKTPFAFPEYAGMPLPLSSILEPAVPERYRITQAALDGHIRRTERDKERGRGFSLKLADVNSPSKTISARYGKDGKECLIPDAHDLPRRLTPREVARLQGFPDDYILDSSDYRAYRQLGNSVAVPVVARIAKKIADELLGTL